MPRYRITAVLSTRAIMKEAEYRDDRAAKSAAWLINDMSREEPVSFVVNLDTGQLFVRRTSHPWQEVPRAKSATWSVDEEGLSAALKPYEDALAAESL